MHVTIKIEFDAEFAETVHSVDEILNNTLPYMVDNIEIKREVEI